MTKRRLAPKEQQLVEDYLAELNKLQAMPIFDKMSLAEVAKHITSVLKERTETQRRTEEAVETEVFFPHHLIVAHAKYLTGKWFRWRLKEGDRQLAVADLIRRSSKWNQPWIKEAIESEEQLQRENR